MVTYKLNGNEKITEYQKSMLEKAKNMPIVFDEDSPRLTSATEKAFRLAAKKRNAQKSISPICK